LTFFILGTPPSLLSFTSWQWHQPRQPPNCTLWMRIGVCADEILVFRFCENHYEPENCTVTGTVLLSFHGSRNWAVRPEELPEQSIMRLCRVERMVIRV
jgi:hypothetical protein